MRGDEHPKRAALRHIRAQTIERVSHGFTRDELGLVEFEDRLKRAYATDAEPELSALVGDLSPEAVHVSAVLGSIEIIVPPNLAVQSAGASVLGSFEGIQPVPSDPDPELPILRVTGRSVLGSIEVRTEVPESRKPRAALGR